MDFQSEEAQRIRSKSQWKRSGREERGRRSGSGVTNPQTIVYNLAYQLTAADMAGTGAAQ